MAAAKAEGLAVTAEVTPHHLALTDAELAGYDAVFKVNPPLRTETDVAALRAACADGTIDAVATDHAPHLSRGARRRTLDAAAPGMLGLETALLAGRPWHGGRVGSRTCPGHARDVLALLSWRPARIAGLAVDQGGDQGGPMSRRYAGQHLRVRRHRALGGRSRPAGQP